MKKIFRLLIFLITVLYTGALFTVNIQAQESWLKPVPTPAGKKVTDTPAKQITDNRSWINYKHSNIIKATAEKYSLDPQLIYATIMTESEGNEHAYRFEPHLNEASYCLGQILESTARSLGHQGSAQELFIPEICIDLIGKYYRDFLDRYGNLSTPQLARAYNTGSPYKRPVRGHLNRFNRWFYEQS